MNITVYYKKRQYGLGESVRQYQVIIKEVGGLYIEKPEDPADSFYATREIDIYFRAAEPAPGCGTDHWAHNGNVEVLGGRLELSPDAARQLAEAILKFLDTSKQKGRGDVVKFDVSEKPESSEEQP